MYNWDDYDYPEGGDFPNNTTIIQRYHLEAEKVNKYYMGVFYYDDTLTMNMRHTLEIKIRNFNKNLFGMDTAEEIESFSDETSPLAEYPFLYYRVHEANTAFGIAKSMKMQRSLRSVSKTTCLKCPKPIRQYQYSWAIATELPQNYSELQCSL
jgi:hypothetical protein|tara:strand:- start:543 stop:1001 length:459 start_codon:yes stop_codon:yes gene_type:complete